MRAMALEKITQMGSNAEPLRLVELPVPEPGPGDVLIRVSVCGVCHTEIDEIEGRTTPPNLPVVPGHQVVGTVEEVGASVSQLNVGDRVGVGWIHSSSGGADENLSAEFRATGRDANGGYAEYMTVGENYAYPIPDVFSDEAAAPLLCAGAVGYRALRLTGLRDGEFLGLTGFGASAHLVLQLAKHLFPESAVYVFARSEREQAFALEMGADWSGDTTESPPHKLHTVIDTTPAWLPVLSALQVLLPGGRLVINAIRKEEADRDLMAGISYEDHLWQEKELKTVANVSSQDIRELLQVAASIPLRAETQVYALEQANDALTELCRGHIQGAKILKI
jgi:propanol-preferring alcohol dehydrogenase